MCLDPRKRESAPVLAAAGLEERLRLAADDQFRAAAKIERLEAEVARLRARLEGKNLEIERLLKGGRDEA